MDKRAFLFEARVDSEVLDAWMSAGWLGRGETNATDQLSQVDIARAQLIRDLIEDFGVNDEAVPIILDLIDQVHGLRYALREVLSALRAHSPPGFRGMGSGDNPPA